MFRRWRVRTTHTGFDVWDPTSNASVGRLEELTDGWLLLAGSDSDAEQIGYLPGRCGAVR
jgi:hypothetical protein